MDICMISGRLKDQSESLFVYPEGKTMADFSDPDFVPLFDLSGFTEQQRQDALTKCEGNTDCQFDLLLTENEALGQAALDIDETNEREKVSVGT